MKDFVKSIRANLDLSQSEFADRYQIDLATLKNWEQGRRVPDGPAFTYLKLIQLLPEEIAQALASEKL